jgi:hypothetical protein
MKIPSETWGAWRSRTFLLGAVGAGSFAATVAASAPASADEYEERHEGGGGAALDLAGDVEGAAVVETPHTAAGNSLGGGTGFKVRVGAQFHLPLVRFVPEVGYGFQHFFAVDEAGAAYDWDTHRVFAGARLGLGEILVPTIYAHFGYGWRGTGDPSVPDAGGTAFDAGVALDLHIIPHVGLGAHAEYATIDAQPYVPQWLAVGLHADIAL